MKNEVTIIVLLFLVICSSSAFSGENKNDYGKIYSISMFELILTPEKFDGEVVQVSGYGLLSDDENMGLYLNESSAKHFIFKNAVSLDDSYKNVGRSHFFGIPEIPEFYLKITGTFKMSEKSKGNEGYFQGKIIDIKFINSLPNLSKNGWFKENFDPKMRLSSELRYVAGKGDIIKIKKLLESGADINLKCDCDGWTALMAAAGAGHIDVVKFLIEKEADVNTEDEDGKTALDYAIEKGHNEIIKLLKQAGAKEWQDRPGNRFDHKKRK